MSTLKQFIKNIIKEELNNNSTNIDDIILNNKYITELKDYISKFNTSEELLRNGGLPIELLDRLAFGFSSEDITSLLPKQLKIMWKDDLENVLYEIQKSKLSPKQWASKINLSEPIEVDYIEEKNKKGFYIQDGHHRYTAAKILNKPLNVELTIKANPITKLSPNLSYDEFHRYIFNLLKNDNTLNEINIR